LDGRLAHDSYIHAEQRTGGPARRWRRVPTQFDRLMGELRIIAPVLGRTVPLARG
jgi:hypothetical protein